MRRFLRDNSLAGAIAVCFVASCGSCGGGRARIDAVVTDAQRRSPVHGLRALGGAGLSVLAVGTRRSAPGLWSRHATRRAIAPDVGADDVGFAARVRSLASEHAAAVIYPGSERSIDALQPLRTSLPAGTVLALPEPGAIDPLRDKASLGAHAREAGLRTPPVLAEGTAVELVDERVPFPCVVKPARSDGAVATARLVSSQEQWQCLVGGLPAEQRLVVQQRVEGPLTALAVVVDRDGALVARFQQEALRTYPPGMGSSSLAVGVVPDDALTRRVVWLLGSVGFWGLAQLQLVGGMAAGALIDFNPRFYGSLPLALASGVNLPAAWHAVTLGEPTGPLGPYRTGVRYRWLEADISAAAHGSYERLLPVRGPRTGAMWAWDDPVPAGLLAWRAARDRFPALRGR